MTDDNKTSNLIIFGIAALAAMLFGYLIYSSRNQQPLQTQPIQQPQLIQQPQSIDTSLLYRLEFQTQQMADNIKLQNDQLKLLQEQQMNQSQSVSQLEAAKCNNVVSMNNNTSSLKPLTISQMKKLPTNKTRENEEEIANRYFGMT